MPALRLRLRVQLEQRTAAGGVPEGGLRGPLDRLPARQPRPEVTVASGIRHLELERRERARSGVRRVLADHAERVALGIDQRLRRTDADRQLEAPRADGRLAHPLEAEVEHGAARHRESGLVAGRLVGELIGAEQGLPEPAGAPRGDGVEDDVLQEHRFTLERRLLGAARLSAGPASTLDNIQPTGCTLLV